jgi:hypothetical protein
MRDGQVHGPGTELSLPVEEVRFMMARGFLQPRPPVLAPPAEPNPSGIGPRDAATQGPSFRR